MIDRAAAALAGRAAGASWLNCFRLLSACALSAMLGACTPVPQGTPDDRPPPAPLEPASAASARQARFVAGPLVVEPPLPAALEGWAGIGIFQNLIASGFSADSKLFANCHAEQTKVLTQACELIDTEAHVAQRVVSSADYGDGHSSAGDPEISKLLGPLGVPAKEGDFRYAEDLRVTWTQASPREARFALRETTTRVETPLALFQRTDRMELAPQRVVVSPDGRRLAIVVYVVGGPPLTTAAKVVELDRAASEAYASAGRELEAKGQRDAAARFFARSRAALSRH